MVVAFSLLTIVWCYLTITIIGTHSIQETEQSWPLQRLLLRLLVTLLSLKWTFHQSHRLLDFGFTGELWACFQVYLSSRRQCVRVEDTSSDFLPVLSGVPQGSIIGPLLFIIYINDLSTGDCLPSNLLLFADDSKCFNRISSTVDCLILQEIINDVISWSDE